MPPSHSPAVRIQFCDRYVIPNLTPADMAALADGERLLDQQTREFVRQELSYRVVLSTDGNEARALETDVRSSGLPRAGWPLINP